MLFFSQVKCCHSYNADRKKQKQQTHRKIKLKEISGNDAIAADQPDEKQSDVKQYFLKRLHDVEWYNAVQVIQKISSLLNNLYSPGFKPSNVIFAMRILFSEVTS